MSFQVFLCSLLAVTASARDCSIPIGGCNGGVQYGNLGLSDGLLGYDNLGLSAGTEGCGNVGAAEGVFGLNNLGISGGDIASSGLYSSGLSSIAGLSVNAPEVVLPSPPSQPIPAVAPRVLSNVCKGVRTIVSSRPMKQVINVPVKRQLTQTFTRPKVETIIYRAKPVSSGLSSLPSFGISGYEYPQIDQIGAPALESSLGSPISVPCLSSLPSYPQVDAIGFSALETAFPNAASCASSLPTYSSFPRC